MVKEIDCSVHGGQFARRFRRPALNHVWLGLLEKQTRPVNSNGQKQAGGNSPNEISTPRRACILELHLEASEFRKAWRAGRQVQPGRVICGQPILCDVL